MEEENKKDVVYLIQSFYDLEDPKNGLDIIKEILNCGFISLDNLFDLTSDDVDNSKFDKFINIFNKNFDLDKITSFSKEDDEYKKIKKAIQNIVNTLIFE